MELDWLNNARAMEIRMSKEWAIKWNLEWRNNA